MRERRVAMPTPPERLTEITHRVTQPQLAKYADASGDHNPLHLDAAFAADTPYGRPIAHGMLVLAFVSESMTKSFGRAWMCGGRMKARFRAPVYPGDTVTTAGALKSTSDAKATYAIVVRNQDGTEVLTADAIVPLAG
jgi:3-hydroxybutyryl-CoA dehydratase